MPSLPPDTPALVRDAVEQAIATATAAAPEGSAAATASLARTLQANALESQALTVWSALAESDGASPAARAEALAGCARCQRATNDAAAMESIQQACAAAPTDPWPRITRGEWALEDGEIEDAVAAFDDAMARAPANDWARVGRARAALDAGDGAAAESLLAPLAARSPWHASLLDSALVMQGKPARGPGASQGDAATRPPSDDPFDLQLVAARGTRDAVLSRVDAALDAKQFTEAMTRARRAVELLPNDPLALDRLASAQAAQGNLAASADTLLRACAIAPNDFGSRFNAGSTLMQLRRLDEALVQLNAACAIAPDKPESHRIRGLTLAMLNRYTDAVAALEPLERNRQLSDVESRLALAIALNETGRPRDAEGLAGSVLSGARKDERVWLVLAEAIRRQGQYARAAATATKGLEFVPGSKGLRDLVARCAREAQAAPAPGATSG
ncbi:MAG: tetratricopeptide repeat protein [Planctomycetota bacterium]|nr:tetratricopeptide repeat protein [Planctomycetota bacterium]